jgi:DNA-binding NarL/FixJ family response regulator
VKTLRIGIVEDDRPTRDGLVALLNGEADTRCLCAFSSVEQALVSPSRDDVDVLLFDSISPGSAAPTASPCFDSIGRRRTS